MHSFNEFIVEKILSELILESKISFSKDFFKVLSSIKNPLAKKILSLQGKDFDSQYNFIDITDENDLVSFTADRRAKTHLGDKDDVYEVINSSKYLTNSEKNKSVFDRLEHSREGQIWIPEISVRGKIVNTTYGSSGKMYVLFQGIEGTNLDKKTVLNIDALKPVNQEYTSIWSTSRSNIKVGRVIRALAKNLSIEVSDSEVEKFVNEYKSHIDLLKNAMKRFDVVTGNQISHFYNIENYADQGRGTLSNSCMAESPESYFYIYVKNPDVCSLVILYDDSGEFNGDKYISKKIVGRSILWKTRSGDMFLDRIYTNNDSDISLFKKFAEQNGWWSKERQDSSNDFKVERSSERKDAKFIVDLKKWDDEFPYVDSLSFFNPKTGELSNSPRVINAQWQLNSTGGSYDELYYNDDDES